MNIVVGLGVIVAAVAIRLRWSEFPLTPLIIAALMGLAMIGVDLDAVITSPAFLILAVFAAGFLLTWLAAFGFRPRRDREPSA